MMLEMIIFTVLGFFFGFTAGMGFVIYLLTKHGKDLEQ